MTINSAHPFFTQLYEPVRKLSQLQQTADGEDLGRPPEPGPLLALDLLLLSMARTQGRLAQTSEEARHLLDNLRREWSEVYRVQLTT